MDPGQLRLRGPPGGHRRREDDQRQPVAGHLTGRCWRSVRSSKMPWLSRIGAHLPSLQTNPSALDGLDLPGWGSLRLALPLQRRQRCVISGRRGGGGGVGTGGRPAERRGRRGEHVDGRRNPSWPTTRRRPRWTRCSAPPIPPPRRCTPSSPPSSSSSSGPPRCRTRRSVVASWLPPGPTAMADYPTVLLSGNWLSQEQVTAASEFARFMRKPEQLAELAKAGFRTEGGTPPQERRHQLRAASARRCRWVTTRCAPRWPTR